MTGWSPAFVSDGLSRLLRAPGYREKRAEIASKIREKYSGEISAAKGYLQRVKIERKVRSEIKQTRPSRYCLWGSQ
jgi:hypothetical protein